MILRYNIEESGYRVKQYLIERGFPETVLKDIKGGNGNYIVNDMAVESHYELHIGDVLEVVIPNSEPGENIISTFGPLDIVYEDSYILILNKPVNIATIPTKEHYTCSLANYVMSYYKRMGILANIHFVSRLDAATSGLIMLGKNSYVTYLLQNSLIEKHYLLETKKVVTPSEGIIENRIEKDPNSIIKRMVVEGASNTKTVYKTINVRDSHSIIDALLCTGKTHQLRIHFSNMGFPIIGDELYGTPALDGVLHLHSYKLSFTHPITKKVLTFENKPTWL